MSVDRKTKSISLEFSDGIEIPVFYGNRRVEIKNMFVFVNAGTRRQGEVPHNQRRPQRRRRRQARPLAATPAGS